MKDIALKLINKITDAGFDAYIVGGFVRDYLLGIESNDVDVNTNATPKDLLSIFKDSISPQEDYGSVTVIYNNIRFEITTFRKETGYLDHRRPEKIEYINDLYEDIVRRDFTINSLCMDKDGNIIDLLNVRDDIDKKIVKAIGNPIDRFREDSLRILRAVRFSVTLEFELDKELIKAIKECSYLLKDLSYYRKKDELDKIFTCKNSLNGIKLLIDLGLDKVLELDNLDKVKRTNSLIGVWAILNVWDKYPFTNNEKALMKDINIVMERNNLDPMTLYKYGLYVNSVAGEMKDLDIKKITESYDNLIIHKRKDLDITSDDIIKCINKKPGPFINEIYNDIENEVLYRRLNNNKEDIIKYIKDKWM